MANLSTKRIILAGLFLSLGLIMPFLTGQIPNIGRQLLPMHIPVLLGGFVLGGPLGALVGGITPLLRSFQFGVPIFFPNAVGMAFELASYGFLTGYFFRRFPAKTPFVYLSLLLAMLGGRLIWGGVSLVLYNLAGLPDFTWKLFLGGAFLQAVPGIVVQVLLLPPLVIALQKRGFLKSNQK